jgi:non-ribosomal peptide synthetase component E (peptide arylation enzyme)
MIFLSHFQCKAQSQSFILDYKSFFSLYSYYLKANFCSFVLYLPERIEMIEEMRLTNVGKVDKKRLREEIKEKLKKEGKI